MPYSTLVAGTVITSSWANTSVRDQAVTPFASTSARDSAITSPVEGMIAPITGDDVITYYNGSVWVCITPQAAVVDTNETTTSTSYTDLATSGPEVTIVTGTSALVRITAWTANTTAGGIPVMSFAVSGATTLAADDDYRLSGRYTSTVNTGIRASAETLLTGLTAGSNTFTAKYKQIGATGTSNFENRVLSVTPIIA